MQQTKIITLESIISQSEGNIVSDMDGEKVMMSIQNGKYYNLGEIGGVIWESIKTPITIKQLISNLINEYNVTEGDCREEVVSFITSLKNEGLIIVEG